MRLPGSILQGILARAALAFLRVYLGVVFLQSSWFKIREGNRLVFSGGHPFYQEFLRQVVEPQASLFAVLIAWGELLVGVTLVLGLVTRFSAALGLLLSINAMLATGAWLWTPSSPEAAYAAIALALLIGAAGRTFGLDALLARRWPRSPWW
jgi:thiosulfate dehydrogenase (quinone) large subunit